MASEAILKELFEVSKASTVFAGMTDENVWNACLKYKDRPDEHIRIAMENIRNKDTEKADESAKAQAAMQANEEKMVAMHQKEVLEHEREVVDADKALEEFFSS